MSVRSFNHLCPMCNEAIHLAGFTIKSCDIPIRPNGWAFMATQGNTNETELFVCTKCEVTVPSEWVYKEMSKKEASDHMIGWGANVYSIHNHKPLPEIPAESVERRTSRKKDDAHSTEPSSPKSEAPVSSTTTDDGSPRLTDTAVRKAI